MAATTRAQDKVPNPALPAPACRQAGLVGLSAFGGPQGKDKVQRNSLSFCREIFLSASA